MKTKQKIVSYCKEKCTGKNMECPACKTLRDMFTFKL